MTQAVVKGPIGKEAAVLGATGRDVCRWLQWQCCGTWSVGQGLVACGDWGGDRLENSGLCLVSSLLGFIPIDKGESREGILAAVLYSCG